MTPARTQAAPRRHTPPPTAAAPTSSPAASAEARRQQLEPARPLAPATAFDAAQQMGVEHRTGQARRRLLAVEAGGQGGTELTAVHPAIVPGATGAPRTTPRLSVLAGGRRA